MKKIICSFLALFLAFIIRAQQDTSGPSGIVIIPYQSMMYFSDADPDLARAGMMDEIKVRSFLRINLEANVYHQLLSSFNAVSLMRATTSNGEADLNRIYSATRYVTHSRRTPDASLNKKGPDIKKSKDPFSRKTKNQAFLTSDSSVMLADIGDKELFAYLHKKYRQKYILFITQFEISTDHKNSIEWLKQDYTRAYTVHYNLFDYTGRLIRAETLTIKAGNENHIKDINNKYLLALANKLKEILITIE